MISNDYVQTGLLTGKSWDRTFHWVEDSVTSLTDSISYGNYNNSVSPANVTGYSTKQNSGYSDKWCVKNIYDLFGNVWKRTNEIHSYDYFNHGGGYYNDGVNISVTYRNFNDENDDRDNLGFRIRPYIK